MLKRKVKKFAATPEWQMDRRIPLALVLTVFLQSAAAVWWAAGQTERQQFQQVRLQQLEVQQLNTAQEGQGTGQRLTRIEERVALMLESLRRIEKRLER